MPANSVAASRLLSSIPTRSFSWMPTFLHHLSSCSRCFDKCLEKCSKKFTVTEGDDKATCAVAITNHRSQLAQPKPIACAGLAGVRDRLRRLPHRTPIGARQLV